MDQRVSTQFEPAWILSLKKTRRQGRHVHLLEVGDNTWWDGCLAVWKRREIVIGVVACEPIAVGIFSLFFTQNW